MSDEVNANRATIRAFFAAAARGEDTMHFLDDNVTWWVPGQWELGGTYTKTELAAVFGKVFAMLAGPPQFIVHAITAEDDRVAVSCESSTQFTDGTPFGNTYHFLFYLRGGKIVAAKEYLDTAYMIGVLAQRSRKAG